MGRVECPIVQIVTAMASTHAGPSGDCQQKHFPNAELSVLFFQTHQPTLAAELAATERHVHDGLVTGDRRRGEPYYRGTAETVVEFAPSPSALEQVLDFLSRRYDDAIDDRSYHRRSGVARLEDIGKRASGTAIAADI
jgi:hypothetical protein